MIKFINIIEKAMSTVILNPKIKIKFKIKDESPVENEEKDQEIEVPEVRKKVKEKKITVYSKTVTF